ncbi:TPA: aldehyde dehydrogenase family protein [Serratia marcescens]|nr:aldehyde dehydrogenase family protein [Serratia marcescens]
MEKKTLKVTSPFDGSLVGELPYTSKEEMEQTLSVSYSLFKDKNKWLSKQKRLEVLKRAAEIIEARKEEIATQASREGGKPLKDSITEVERGIDGIHTSIETLRTDAGKVIPMDLNPTSAQRLAFTQYEPIGVVVGITAFNHPFNLVIHQVISAVAVGAPIIVKPASSTPFSCKTLVDIMAEAGLPDGWAKMVLPSNNALMSEMLGDERIAFFSFVGSSNVGWSLHKNLAPGVRCVLEHGGVAPVIIAKDADLDDGLPRIARGGFWHAGQACVGVQRVFCDSSIAQDVAKRLAGLGNDMIVGDPLRLSTDVGPLISEKELNRVASWVDEAVKAGGQLLSGGKILSNNCYAPTVILAPPLDSDLMQKEVFGPVIVVYPFDELDHAIEIANSLPYAFQAAVFTRDLDTAMYCYKRMDGTAVMVNENTLFRVDWMPFSGAKLSGYGVGGIPHTMHDMQTEKMMVWRSNAIN